MGLNPLIRAPVRILAVLAFALAFAAPASAQAPPAGLWQAEAGRECFVTIRDATPVWRVRLDLMRLARGRMAFILGVNVPDAPVPRVREDRLRLVFVAADGRETPFSVPIAGGRTDPSGRPMLSHALVAGGPGLERMLEAARGARAVRVALPGLGPYEIPSAGFTEAWAGTDACVPVAAN